LRPAEQSVSSPHVQVRQNCRHDAPITRLRPSSIRALLKAFGVSINASQREINTTLMRSGMLLLEEVESLAASLRTAGHSEESIKSIVRPFDFLSGAGLAAQWQSYVQGFSAIIPLLLFASETLPEDGEFITEKDLLELSGAIESLRNQVGESTLPEQVKKFIFEQLDIIIRAIRDYPLTGTKAFKAAVHEAVFHLGAHSEVVAEYAKTPEISKLKQIQEQVVMYAKYAINVSNFIRALDIFYQSLQGAPAAAHELSDMVKHVLK
jgi:hypothetical protein